MSVSVAKVMKAAQEIGISPRSAVMMRMRFLQNEIAEWVMIMEEGEDPELVSHYALPMVEEMCELAVALPKAGTRAEAVALKDRITDSQIELAKQYPMTDLVEFIKGKAIAPCHDDRRPSMYYGARKNLAVCPVCDKKWNPIQWVMEFEGLNFPDAVRRLGGVGWK